MDQYYSFTERTYGKVNNNHYHLHTHDEYEIYMFLEGNSNYVVEDKMYDLEPGDIIIIRKNEMHRVHHKEECEYKSLVLMISPEYFKRYDCEEYEKAFTDSFLDSDNKISIEMAKKTGLFDAISRLRKYSDSCKNTNAPVITATITEILYLINNISEFKPSTSEHPFIKDIIKYLAENLEHDTSLDKLANEFYVSKYHLCHIFKKFTGLTIGEYVNQKRLALVNDLVKNGESIGNAAIKSGFANYYAYYRAYTKNNNKKSRTNKQI